VGVEEVDGEDEGDRQQASSEWMMVATLIDSRATAA